MTMLHKRRPTIETRNSLRGSRLSMCGCYEVRAGRYNTSRISIANGWEVWSVLEEIVVWRGWSSREGILWVEDHTRTGKKLRKGDKLSLAEKWIDECGLLEELDQRGVLYMARLGVEERARKRGKAAMERAHKAKLNPKLQMRKLPDRSGYITPNDDGLKFVTRERKLPGGKVRWEIYELSHWTKLETYVWHTSTFKEAKKWIEQKTGPLQIRAPKDEWE